MSRFPFTEPVTRRREEQTGVDRYGNPVYERADELLDELAAFDPGGSREPVEVGREPVVTNPKAYFATDVDITRTDRLLIRGIEWQVIGEPARWRSAFGSDFGTVVELQAVAEGV